MPGRPTTPTAPTTPSAPDAPSPTAPGEDGHGPTLLHGYVPVIDLGLDAPPNARRRAGVAEAVRKACETSGFLVVVGHGVPEATVTALYEAAGAFFRGPAEVRAGAANDPDDPLQHGYGANDRMHLFGASLLGERSEDRFPGLDAPNRWPDQPGFREAFLEYYRAATGLSVELMRLFALALNLPETWFDDKFERHMTPMMVNYYPPRTGVTHDKLRNSPHTDFGSLTVLYQDEAPGGLQVRDQHGRWLDVPPLPGSFVVNLGRLMTRWTNDRWASTVHRVVNPAKEQEHLDRISIAFFYQADPEAEIACIPTCTTPDDPPHHPPVRSGDYFLSKSRRAYILRSMGRLDAAP
ncbi:isopenicillin N synthase family dioxygenase [Kitasatospora sp. NPDC059973]|uniref:isopenicillin N synthase family dioxygenase n=1 Tax=Kitasatospora sp. NPDC059973 TaxID=3347020 RepID=UPI00368DA738